MRRVLKLKMKAMKTVGEKTEMLLFRCLPIAYVISLLTSFPSSWIFTIVVLDTNVAKIASAQAGPMSFQRRSSVLSAQLDDKAVANFTTQMCDKRLWLENS